MLTTLPIFFFLLILNPQLQQLFFFIIKIHLHDLEQTSLSIVVQRVVNNDHDHFTPNFVEHADDPTRHGQVRVL